MLSDTTKIASLGSRLKDARLNRNESQETFAARLGISIPTLRRMETGDANVAVGHWVAALRILDRETDLDNLLAPKQDLFAKFDSTTREIRRQRSRKKRS